MNIEDMAQRYSEILLGSNHKFDDCSQIVKESFELAEAMQEEFNKRKPQGIPVAIKFIKLAENHYEN